jgi:hypothetical protein
VRTAQTNFFPAARAMTPLNVPLPPTPVTWTGVEEPVVVPSPSWPLSFRPQQYTAPPVVRAQVCDSPATTPAIPDRVPLPPTPTTWTGVDEFPVVPSPRRPSAPLPQQNTAPEPFTAQACSVPSPSAVIPVRVPEPPTPTTWTGVAESVVVPLPSCPLLLRPQQYMAPESSTAQVKTPPSPASTATMSPRTPVPPTPSTVTGR